MSWLGFWLFVLVLGCGLYAALVVRVGYHGFLELKTLLRSRGTPSPDRRDAAE